MSFLLIVEVEIEYAKMLAHCDKLFNVEIDGGCIYKVTDKLQSA